MINAYQQLESRFRQLSKIDHALTFLNWDQMVTMPSGGMSARAASVAELAGMHHELLTRDELIRWLEDAEAEAVPEQTASLREMRRVWQQASALPAQLVKQQIVAGSRCEHAWRTQRGDNDWQGFLVNFREVVDLSREEARLRQQASGDAFATPYDSLLDLHCAGDSTALIDSVFDRLKVELPVMLPEIMDRQQLRKTEPLSGNYPVAQQRELSHRLMQILGFDFEQGRLDESMHPFSTGVKGDLRITTRYRNDEFLEALSSTAHETGHASYEGGLPENWDGVPAGQARNMCLHESQSLLFEKQILLSRAFTTYFTPAIHELLPESRKYDSQSIWNRATQVKPGFIRVEADEVTYPLHVLLRYEIEKSLINGAIEAVDIPDIWNDRMQQYLGLSTTDDFANGCLQDIHWTDGAFGYFPSYTLGAVNGAQIFSRIRKLHPDWQERFASGDCGFVAEWLANNIWSRGCSLESQALMQAATGEGTNPDHFLQHIKARYISDEY